MCRRFCTLLSTPGSGLWEAVCIDERGYSNDDAASLLDCVHSHANEIRQLHVVSRCQRLMPTPA